MDKLNERLVLLMDKLGYKKSEWAELLNVSPAVISHIYSNRNKAGVELVQMMLLKFPDISERWLLLGEGEMMKGEQVQIAEIVREKLQVANKKIQIHKGQIREITDLMDEIIHLVSKSS